MPQRKRSQQEKGPQRNEGCLNCGTVEEYPGSSNPNIRYLCGICVCLGVAKQEHAVKEFELLEQEFKASKRPLLRLRRKHKKKEKKTIGSC